MFIYNILCKYTEYRRKGDIWVLSLEGQTSVDSTFIQNMLDSGYYFTSMGGTQEVDFIRNRRFGMQVSSITCISFCDQVKKEFSFSYDNAKGVDILHV